MANILEQVARSSRRSAYGHFRPSTPQEFLALQLAIRLGDGAAARHYAELADQYSEGQLLTAYRRVLSTHLDVARRFHVALKPLKGHGCSTESRSNLCAIRIERRAVAVAILEGDHLLYVAARELSSSPGKAVESASRFITRRVTEQFQFASAALEIIPNGHEKQRLLLHQAVLQALRPMGIGILEVSRTDMLQAFGYPPPHSRQELREIVSDIYPVLDQEQGQPWTHDAAALGLYVQTERLFNTINQSLHDWTPALHRRQKPPC
jgi:hypothetical protein